LSDSGELNSVRIVLTILINDNMKTQENKYEILIKVGPYNAEMVVIKAWSEAEALKKAEKRYPASYKVLSTKLN